MFTQARLSNSLRQITLCLAGCAMLTGPAWGQVRKQLGE